MKKQIKKKILLVEDEPAIALLESQYLQDEGYEIIHTSTGEEAIDIIKEMGSEIDLILMDIDLGKGMDGTESAEVILKYFNKPLLFLSSHTEPEIVEKTERITSYGYIVKSSEPTVLYASIKMAFRLYESQEALIKRTKMEKLISNISSMAVSNDSQESFLSRSIEMIGQTIKISRVYIFEHDHNTDTMSNTYEWCSSGISPQKEMLQNIPSKDVQWWFSSLSRGNILCYSDIENIPDEGAKDILRSQDILSLLVVPLFLKNKYYGFIGFDDCHNHRIWPKEDIELLESAARTITSFIERDINAREIIRARDRYASIISVSNTGAWEYHLDSDYLWCSPEYFQMLGYDPDKFKMNGRANLKETWIDLLHPDDRITAPDTFSEYLSSNSTGFYENYFRMIKNDGNIVWIWSRGKRLKDRHGNLTDLTVGTHIDITAGKLAEDKIKKERDLAEKYLDIAGVIILALDREGRINLINKKGCRVLNWEYNEIIGKNWFDNFIPQKEKEAILSGFNNLLKGKTDQFNYYENNVLTKDGNKRTIAWYNSLLEDEEGKIIGTLSSGEDITEKKKANEHIKQLLAEKELILKESHHRVKNNLNSIYSLIMLQSIHSQDKKCSEILKDSAMRVNSMTVLYNKLYRSETHYKMDLSKYLESLFHEIINVFDKERKIKTDILIDDIILNTKTLSSIGIIFNELITNSIKHAFQYTSAPSISLSAHRSDESIILIYQDNGKGIADIDLDNPDTFGLQLIQLIVQQLKGNIKVINDNGAKFIIELEYTGKEL